MEQFCYYRPNYNPELESWIERINPPRVCIDNEASEDCTLVKVDSANKHGILLEMVQILTDLDLVISKSYICSDGGWFMDVFHVTDKYGNKVTDEALIQYIQKAICTKRSSQEAQICPGEEVRPLHVTMDHTALEMTMADQPGLLSEVAAVLAELGCHVSAAVAWTHNHRGACIIYVEDKEIGRPITDQKRLSHIQKQLQALVEAHHTNGEKQSVQLTTPATSQTHTERRLHQLMLADKDYEPCTSCGGTTGSTSYGKGSNGIKYYESNDGVKCECTAVTIGTCKEKGYAVINIRCLDRPKLLFDTVCALFDMQYMVFHATISSNSSIAAQEYYVRRKDGCTLNSVNERGRVRQCLIAAVERRATQGLKIKITAKNRIGLLSDVTRVIREHGLSVKRAEVGTSGENATGTFYLCDTSGCKISTEMVEMIERKINGTVVVHDKSSGKDKKYNVRVDDKPSLLRLLSLVRSRIERLSGNFGPVWSSTYLKQKSLFDLE